MKPLLLALAAALASALIVPSVSAADFSKPNMFFQALHSNFCFERVGPGNLSLFGCDDDISFDPFLLSRPVQEASARMFPARPAETHAATRFARLAGKFMGRVDAATVGSFRVRFVVILE